MKIHALVMFTLAVVCVLSMPAAGGDAPAKGAPAKAEPKPAPAKAAEPKVVSESEAKKVLEKFARQFATEDLDFKLEALLELVKTHHPKVAAVLLKLMKNDEMEIKVEAMRGLGRQFCYRKKLLRKLGFWVDEEKFEPRLVAATIQAIHALDLRKLEEVILPCIDSPDDDVAISTMRALGDWKSYKVLKGLLNLWEFYPTNGTWSTGSVRVDTGAAGTKDAKAAKAKWMGKYGNRPKKARPELVKALRATANQIVGHEDESKEFKKPKDLREWISENKRMLRKYR
jgi:hypothetical protein